MALNALGAVDIALSNFAGTDTELSPADLPEGASPDNQDVAFLPGSVLSRPCLKKALTDALPDNVAVTYLKTYTQPDEQAFTLILDSLGRLWREDVNIAPSDDQLIDLIAQLAAGSYAKSCSAFGREYIALSDGKHGTNVPLQYDGTHLDRVSQDGPGSPPSVADETASIALTSIVPDRLPPSAYSLSQVGHLVTITGFASSEVIPPELQIGDFISVTGAGVSGYNGVYPITSFSETLTIGGNFQITLQYIATASGLASSTTVQGPLLSLALVTPATAYVPTLGQLVTISGASVAGYDGSWPVRSLSTGAFTIGLSAAATGLANSTGGTVVSAGSISVGVHKIVQMFLTRSGYITQPSPVGQWSAAGSLRARITNLAIGPANVVARILAFTPAGGANFFYVPNRIVLDSGQILPATVVPNNTDTSVTLDFADNALMAATSIDVPGRNLFAQTVLTPCLGFFNYASRIFAWGEYNNVENFLNMGFDGGYFAAANPVPTGWEWRSAGGILVNGGAWEAGQAWQIIGDGTSNQKGLIQQSAYQDENGIAILEPLTKYKVRVWVKADVDAAPLPGAVLAFWLQSDATPLTVTANLDYADLPTEGGFIEAEFDALPAVIPPDLKLQIFGFNWNTGKVVLIDELEILFVEQPFFDTAFRASYAENPEAFDAISGVIGSASDPTPIRVPFEYRDTAYFHTAAGLHATRDTGSGEPATWTVAEVTKKAGALSIFASDAGELGSGEAAEDFNLVAARSGLYIFGGGDLFKISQEIQSYWERINWAAQHTLWIKNDSVTRRAYIGVPLDSATVPNQLLVMDYRDLDSAAELAYAAPIKQSSRGGLIALESARKWTRWNVTANCGEILKQVSNAVEFALGGGNGADGSSAFGNYYTLDPTLYVDDDYGAIAPYYFTCFFVDQDKALALGLGAHRLMAAYLTMFISGLGQVLVTPYVNTLTNPWDACPALDLAQNRNYDTEVGLNVTGEKIGLKLAFSPAAGSQEVQFDLSRLCLSLRKDPWAPIRGLL